MKCLHDRKEHIEPNQVGQRQRTNRMVAAELHPFVYVLRTGISLREDKNCFVDHRQQHAIDDEAGCTFYGDRRLTQPCRQRCDRSVRGVARRVAKLAVRRALCRALPQCVHEGHHRAAQLRLGTTAGWACGHFAGLPPPDQSLVNIGDADLKQWCGHISANRCTTTGACFWPRGSP
jgi:hypothetical protein